MQPLEELGAAFVPFEVVEVAGAQGVRERRVLRGEDGELVQTGTGRCGLVGVALQESGREHGSVFTHLLVAKRCHLERRHHEVGRDHRGIPKRRRDLLEEFRQGSRELARRHGVVVRRPDVRAELLHDREVLLLPDALGAELLHLVRLRRRREVLHEQVAVGKGRTGAPRLPDHDLVEVFSKGRQGRREVNAVDGPDGLGVLRVLPRNFEAVVESRDHPCSIQVSGFRQAKGAPPEKVAPLIVDWRVDVRQASDCEPGREDGVEHGAGGEEGEYEVPHQGAAFPQPLFTRKRDALGRGCPRAGACCCPSAVSVDREAQGVPPCREPALSMRPAGLQTYRPKVGAAAHLCRGAAARPNGCVTG